MSSDDADRGLNMIIGIGLFSAIVSALYGTARAREPLPEWKRKSAEGYPVGGPGPGGVGVITDPGIVSYGGLEMPVQPPGWHEEIIEERVAEGLPHEAIIEEYDIPPPPPPAEKADVAKILKATRKRDIPDELAITNLAQGGPPIISPYLPEYEEILAEVYRPEIAALEKHRALTHARLSGTERERVPMPRKTRGRR